MNTENYILIRMPGAGKSTVGVVLAKVLGYEFVDSDLVIQKATGKLLKDIIAKEGVDGFLEIENHINAALDAHHCIIATGGSVIYGTEAMKHLKSIGTVIYLKLSYDDVTKRLGSLKDRGVALHDGQTLKDLYDERTVLYEKYADITIDEANLSIRDTVDQILGRIY